MVVRGIFIASAWNVLKRQIVKVVSQVRLFACLVCTLLFVLPAVAHAHSGEHKHREAARAPTVHAPERAPNLLPSCPGGNHGGCCCGRNEFNASGQPGTFIYSAALLRVSDWIVSAAASPVTLLDPRPPLAFAGAAGPRAPPPLL